MGTAKVTSRPTETASVRTVRPTRSSKATGEEEKLAKELDRVLQVSQPKKVGTRPLQPAPSNEKVKPQARSVPAKFVKTSAHPTVDKGKGKAVHSNQSYPWEEPELSSVERARIATQAVNDSLKIMTLAIHAGYRHGSAKRIEEWTEEKVMCTVKTCEAALKSLRKQEVVGELGDRGVEVERAGQCLVVRCLALAMVR